MFLQICYKIVIFFDEIVAFWENKYTCTISKRFLKKLFDCDNTICVLQIKTLQSAKPWSLFVYFLKRSIAQVSSAQLYCVMYSP